MPVPVQFIRHLLAIAILPFTVTIVVPLWIAGRNHVALSFGRGTAPLTVQLAGAALLSIGLLLFAASLRRFATEGQGTLAPWDPPRVLVIRGPYRWVRNPMISGVIFVLFGEALVFRSLPHFEWATGVLLINLIYIPLLEEPELEIRFGESYRQYCRHVPRVFPRLRPWVPPRTSDEISRRG